MPSVTELYFLRHAHAGDPAAWHQADALRPLSEKGRRQADRLARFLASVGFQPDAIVTSPKVRAAETAAILGERLGVPVGTSERLGTSMTITELDRILDEAGDPARPVLVGHDPDFSLLTAELCGASEIVVRKGALVRIDAERPLVPGSGELRWIVPPDLLKVGT